MAEETQLTRVVSPIDLLCVAGHAVAPVRSKGLESMAVRPIVEEESFQMLRWSPVVKEGVEFRIAREVAWSHLTTSPAKSKASFVGHVEGIALRRSKDVQRQSPV
jgi:hypothetical protein